MDWAPCLENGVATLDCLPIVLKNLIFGILVLAGVAALFFIFYGSFKYVVSKGDPKKFEEARQTIVYAFIGLIIIFLAFFSLNIISFVTGVKCIKLIGFSTC